MCVWVGGGWVGGLGEGGGVCMSESVYACVSAAYNIATIIFVQTSFQQLGASQMFLIPKRFLARSGTAACFFTPGRHL